MFKLLITIFLISAGVFIYSYFRELNPGTVIVHTAPGAEFELSPVTLVLISMALGAVLATLVVGLQQTTHLILNWRSNRLVRRKEKVDTLHRDGTHAFMSKRTIEAIHSWRRLWPSIPIESIHSCGWGISTDQSRIILKQSDSISMHNGWTIGTLRSCWN